MAEQITSSSASNPYAAPQAAVDDAPAGEMELAERGTRLAAAIIDGICIGGIGIVAAIVIPALQKSGSTNTNLVSGIVGIVMIVGFLAVIGINLWLLSTQAATIGKRAMKIRIARTDGTQPGLARLIFMRGLPQWLVGAIPYIGNLFSLIDVLFIFREDRRCVHDRIADTVVIKAPGRA